MVLVTPSLSITYERSFFHFISSINDAIFFGRRNSFIGGRNSLERDLTCGMTYDIEST